MAYFGSYFESTWTQQNKQCSLTFVESSNIFVCSAMNLTQKQLLWTSMGQLVCENEGCLNTGLLIPEGTAVSAAVDKDNSSDSECGTGRGP